MATAECEREHLSSPGGAGKSSFVLQLVQECLDRNCVPFVLDFAESRAFSNSDGDDLSGLFLDYSLAGTWVTFETAMEEGEVLLILDSINERPLDWGRLLPKITELGMRPGVRVLVVDRMFERRELDAYALFSILPLPRSVVRASARCDIPEELAELLAAPFFLALYGSLTEQGKNSQAPTRASMLECYLRDVHELSPEELQKLASVSYEWYAKSRGTEIDAGTFATLCRVAQINPSREQDFQEAGLVSVGRARRFRHQTLHDYLVGQHLAGASPLLQQRVWRAEGFDIATLDGVSLDALDFALEIAGKNQTATSRSDAFLTEVYDWNYGYTLELIRIFKVRSARAPVSDALLLAIFLLNVEKVFDRFDHTAKKTIGGLKKSVIVDDFDFSTCSCRNELVRLVDEYVGGNVELTSSGYWQTWYALFSRQDLTTPEDLPTLWRDPVLAWTAANAFRRVGFDEAFAADVRRHYSSSAATGDGGSKAACFRWRLVHLLGRARDLESFELLVRVLGSWAEDKWVRYGAARSCMEYLSYQCERERRELMGTLISEMRKLFDRRDETASRARQQLRQAVLLRRDSGEVHPAGWLVCCLEMLAEGRALASGKQVSEEVAAEAKEWDSRLHEVETLAEGESRSTSIEE